MTSKIKGEFICPICSGFGKLLSLFPVKKLPSKGENIRTGVSMLCNSCKGTGKMQAHEESLLWMAQGRMLKQDRLSKNISLRRAAKMLNMDVSNLSKMENGLLKPKNVYAELTNEGK